MAWVIFDGTGTYTIGGVHLRAGANEVNDPAVLEKIARKNRPHIRIQEDRTVPADGATTPEPVVPEATPEPLEPVATRDGKWTFIPEPGSAVEPGLYDTEDEALIAIEKARRAGEELVPVAGTVPSPGPGSGTLTSQEADATEFPCRAQGCTKVLKTAGARTNHERVKHPGAQLQDAPPPADVPPVADPELGQDGVAPGSEVATELADAADAEAQAAEDAHAAEVAAQADIEANVAETPAPPSAPAPAPAPTPAPPAPAPADAGQPAPDPIAIPEN